MVAKEGDLLIAFIILRVNSTKSMQSQEKRERVGVCLDKSGRWSTSELLGN